jgi:hypothetical protein
MDTDNDMNSEYVMKLVKTATGGYFRNLPHKGRLRGILKEKFEEGRRSEHELAEYELDMVAGGTHIVEDKPDDD